MSAPESASHPTHVPAAQRPQRPQRRFAGGLQASEFRVLFSRPRTRAMLAALALVPVLIAVAVRLSSTRVSGRAPSFIESITQNGLFVAVAAILLSTPLFLPLTIGVVAGDAIAGEAAQGTLRYLLVVPAGRLRLLRVKFVGAAVFSFVAPLVIVAVGAGVGAVLFPVGRFTLLSGTQVSVAEGLVRLLLIALYTGVAMLGLTAIGIAISTFTDAPVGAMAATVVVAVTSQVLDALPQLDALHPWLLTDPWTGFVDLLRDPILWSTFGSNVLVQLGYVVVFGAIAVSRFTTRDVLA